MYLFIDESRNFQVAPENTRAVSCVSCLVIPEENYEAVKRDFAALKDAWGHMPNQLYIQNVVMAELVANIVQRASLYYVQRKPKELGRFCWVIDAKDKAITRYEEFWKKMTLPALQSMGFEKPLLLLRGADYSSFMRFHGEMSESPVHLRKARGYKAGSWPYLKINEIMKEISFDDSVNVPCLQLVDVLCNAIQRAMNGNLQPHGWDLLRG